MPNSEPPVVNPHVAVSSDIAYIALGSNLGDRQQHLATARDRLARVSGVRVLAESMIEETSPIGPVEQGAYLNQMIAIETTLSPLELWTQLSEIEKQGGRTRTVRWGPRTIDLDIVRYERTTWDDATLHLPHVELPNREFWIRELAEVRAMLAEQCLIH